MQPVCVPTLFSPVSPQPNAPLWVYFSGMDGTGLLLRSQLAGLSEYFDIRCLAIPKHDRSDWKALSAHVIPQIVREQGSHQRPVYLCGESFGGCLALAIANQFSSPHHRLILVNPATSVHQLWWLRCVSLGMPLLPAPLYRSYTLNFLPLLGNLNHIDPTDRHAFTEAVLSLPQATVSWRLAQLVAFNVDALPLNTLRQPTLIAASLADLLLPSYPEALRLCQQIPDCNVAKLSTSRHAALLERQVNLTQILRQAHFLPS